MVGGPDESVQERSERRIGQVVPAGLLHVQLRTPDDGTPFGDREYRTGREISGLDVLCRLFSIARQTTWRDLIVFADGMGSFRLDQPS